MQTAMAFVMLTKSQVVKMQLLVTTMPQQRTRVHAFSPMATVKYVMATEACLFRTLTAMAFVTVMKSQVVRTQRHATMMLQRQMMMALAFWLMATVKCAMAMAA